jgi:hypothetical protein
MEFRARGITFALVAVLLVSALAHGEQANVVEIDSIKDSELPTMVEVTEAVKIRLVSESGSAGLVGLPKGAKVEVTGRDGNMLQVLFAKSAGQIDIYKTTALAEVAKIRAQEEQEKLARGAAFFAEADRLDRERELEKSRRRDILVHSWQWRERAGGDFYEAVGEIENESGRVLEKVQVEITIRDANDSIVSTETALANDRNLSPGQRTTFRAMIGRVGGEQKASLTFRKLWGERYTHREK